MIARLMQKLTSVDDTEADDIVATRQAFLEAYPEYAGCTHEGLPIAEYLDARIQRFADFAEEHDYGADMSAEEFAGVVEIVLLKGLGAEMIVPPSPSEMH
jgi:hypothetical protein